MKENDTNNLNDPSYWSWHKAQKASISLPEAEEEHSPVPAGGSALPIATCLSYFCHVHFPSRLLCAREVLCSCLSAEPYKSIWGWEEQTL